jgi:methyl-accepting chemotaxis protein
MHGSGQIRAWPDAVWAAAIALPGAVVIAAMNGVSLAIPMLLITSFGAAWLGLLWAGRGARTAGLAVNFMPAAPALPDAAGTGPKENATAFRDDLNRRLQGFAEHFQAYRAVFQRACLDTASATADTEAATTAIVGELKTINEAMGELLAFLDRSSTSGDVQDSFKRTGEHLEANRHLITAFLSRRDADMQESRARLGEVEAVTQNLANDVQSIRDVAQSTRMLALNAAIEAARAGALGAGFAVVASEVKILSHQSDETAAKIGRGLDHLQDVVRANMAGLMEKRIDHERAELDTIANSITMMTTDQENLVNHQRDVLVKVKEESDRIAKPITALMGSIQFQDIVRQRLEHLQKIFRVAEANSTTLEGSLIRLADGEALPGARALVEITEDLGPAPTLHNKVASIEFF